VTWTSRAYEAVARLVRDRAGLTFGETRRHEAESGIRRAMARAGVDDVERYAALLGDGALAIDDLLAELTVGESHFFREPAHFELIRDVVVPEVLARRGPAHAVRAWSAGCASGEEPYSLAMLFEELGLAGRAHIVASDLSPASLARAQAGAYRPWSLRGTDEAMLRRWFRRAGDRHVVDERIRKAVTFAVLNLAADTYPSLASGTWALDLILCRNVLIYFDRPTVARVAERLHRALAPGGWLLTGSSDPSLSTHAPFETVTTPSGIHYRRAAEAAGARPPAPPPPPPRQPAAAPPPRAPAPPPPAPVDRMTEARSALAGGDYDRVLALAADDADPAAGALAVRALANRDGPEAAERLAARAARRHALQPELHYLHALLLLDAGRVDEAARAARRVLYLDPSLAMAHFALGTIEARRGEVAAARRAFALAADLAGALPPDEALPLGDGERAGRLARLAAAQAEVAGGERAS
jgi:chemotaxis protein methyltransferase CheR